MKSNAWHARKQRAITFQKAKGDEILLLMAKGRHYHITEEHELEVMNALIKSDLVEVVEVTEGDIDGLSYFLTESGNQKANKLARAMSKTV